MSMQLSTAGNPMGLTIIGNAVDKQFKRDDSLHIGRRNSPPGFRNLPHHAPYVSKIGPDAHESKS
jgi:hypothetical protein